MKPCSQCGITKPLEQFHRRTSRAGGYASECKACKSERVRDYRRRNLTVVRQRSREWYEANRERSTATTREWQRAHPGWGTANSKHWEQARRRAVPPWADRKAMAAIYLEARSRSAQTGVKWHVDHVVPLQGKNVCGLHVETNLRVIPARDNILKSNRLEVMP